MVADAHGSPLRYGRMTWSVAGSYWTVHMKKILLLLAVAGAAVFLVQRRRQAAAAEAALWDEATGKPSTAGGYPGPTR